MTEMVAQTLAAPPRLKPRLAIIFTAVVLVACIVAAALLFSHALTDRQAVRDRALSTAIALSFGFDQEVAAGNALLKGLSSSPALRAGDVKGFYDQLIATPISEGSWLILQDMEGQVVNTLRPFGAALPRHRDFPNYPEALDRVRERGWAVSGRMASIVKSGATTIGLSLRINHPDGSMKGFITTVLSEDRLGAILAEPTLPEGWTRGLYDRKFQPIVTSRGVEKTPQASAPGGFRARLAAGNQDETTDGVIEDVDEHGLPILIAYRRSGATNWTTAVSVPLALVNAPLTGMMRQLAGPAAFLLLIGGLAALFTARQVEHPLRSLSNLVSKAEGEISELSGQLLALQEEERQRIARELHDSTAQRLVAAGLGLGRLEAKLQQNQAGLKICGEIAEQLDGALMELRTFTYLLHPPNLANDGLRSTLEEFVEGFARRTGLHASIQVSKRLDEAPAEIQRCVLRVVQEALANVHRHAGASRVHVGAKLVAERLVVRIRDNGRGMKRVDPSADRHQMGVGIPGMHARLQQFGGDLKIRTGPQGTSLLAYVPLSEPSRLSALILPLHPSPQLRARGGG
jgi:two-component system NarL family sensor kinase